MLDETNQNLEELEENTIENTEEPLIPEEIEIEEGVTKLSRKIKVKKEEDNYLDEVIDLGELVVTDDYSGPHDAFDWSVSNKNTVNYSEADQKKYITDYDSTFRTILDGQLLNGRVSTITGNDVLLDIQYKSDGLIPLSEFRDMDIKVRSEK